MITKTQVLGNAPALGCIAATLQDGPNEPHLLFTPSGVPSYNVSGLVVCVTRGIGQKWWHVTSKPVYKRLQLLPWGLLGKASAALPETILRRSPFCEKLRPPNNNWEAMEASCQLLWTCRSLKAEPPTQPSRQITGVSANIFTETSSETQKRTFPAKPLWISDPRNSVR